MSEKELESFATSIQEKILGLPNPDSADFDMPTVLHRTIGFQR
jgi:hypothetical protein